MLRTMRCAFCDTQNMLGPIAKSGGPSAISEAMRSKALDQIIREELTAQAAENQGLTEDKNFRLLQEDARVRVRAGERKAVAELFRKAVSVKVGDAEIDALIEAHKDQYNTDYHMNFILIRNNEANLQKAQTMTKKGLPFEQIARGLISNLQEGQTPWDIGFVNKSLLDPEWKQAVLSMKPGDTSAIIPVKRNCYWILHLM